MQTNTKKTKNENQLPFSVFRFMCKLMQQNEKREPASVFRDVDNSYQPTKNEKQLPFTRFPSYAHESTSGVSSFPVYVWIQSAI